MIFKRKFLKNRALQIQNQDVLEILFNKISGLLGGKFTFQKEIGYLSVLNHGRPILTIEVKKKKGPRRLKISLNGINKTKFFNIHKPERVEKYVREKFC